MPKKLSLVVCAMLLAALACGSLDSAQATVQSAQHGVLTEQASSFATIDAAGTEVSVHATPAGTPQRGTVGERVEANGVVFTINKVSTATAIEVTFSTPEPGKIFLVLDVTIENISHDQVMYNPLFFKVKDADGFEYEAGLFAPEPMLQSMGTLTKGDKVRGNVALEVPITAKGLVVDIFPIAYPEVTSTESVRIDIGDVPAP